MGDLETLGFLFESLCERDLAVYAAASGGRLFSYRDGLGRGDEIAVVELADGRWGAFRDQLWGETNPIWLRIPCSPSSVTWRTTPMPSPLRYSWSFAAFPRSPIRAPTASWWSPSPRLGFEFAICVRGLTGSAPCLFGRASILRLRGPLPMRRARRPVAQTSAIQAGVVRDALAVETRGLLDRVGHGLTMMRRIERLGEHAASVALDDAPGDAPRRCSSPERL